MKSISVLIAFSLGFLIMGCSKDTESFQEYPRPVWTAATPDLFPSSFTAVLSVPTYINTYSEDADMVAAFIGDECRGVGNLVKSDDGLKRVYYITVRASDTENRPVVFKYYSSKLSYMYQAKTPVEFEIDGTYGTYDSPVTLDLEHI